MIFEKQHRNLFPSVENVAQQIQNFTDQSGTILGAHRLITYDQPMINGYMAKRSPLERRLQAMTGQLLSPYDQATLPQLMTPDDVLKEWAG